MSDSRFYDMSSPISLGDLVSRLGLKQPEVNVADEAIDKVAALQNSQRGDLVFLNSKKMSEGLEGAKATACLTTEKLAPQVAAANIVPLISESPRADFGRAIKLIYSQKDWSSAGVEPRISSSAKVHPSAVIGADAHISDDVMIGPFAVIGPGVQIGPGTRIESHVSIECAQIGAKCLIKSGACIGGSGFGMEPGGEGVTELPHVGRVLVGDHVWIGSQTCVDRGFIGDTVIGDHVKVDNLVQIAHNVSIGDRTIIAGRVGISGSVIIGEGVMLGGSVGLSDHITIGDGAQLAASSGVMHNVPAGEVWAGTPAMPFRDFMKMTASVRRMTLKKKDQKS